MHFLVFSIFGHGSSVIALIHFNILLVKRGSRDSRENNCWPHGVYEGIKSINARVLMPGGNKPEVVHASRENA